MQGSIGKLCLFLRAGRRRCGGPPLVAPAPEPGPILDTLGRHGRSGPASTGCGGRERSGMDPRLRGGDEKGRGGDGGAAEAGGSGHPCRRAACASPLRYSPPPPPEAPGPGTAGTGNGAQERHHINIITIWIY